MQQRIHENDKLSSVSRPISPAISCRQQKSTGVTAAVSSARQNTVYVMWRRQNFLPAVRACVIFICFVCSAVKVTGVRSPILHATLLWYRYFSASSVCRKITQWKRIRCINQSGEPLCLIAPVLFHWRTWREDWQLIRRRLYFCIWLPMWL